MAIKKYPDVVPNSNDEMVKLYGRFVGGLVTRHNKVERNFEDLLQHIWASLLKAQVLERYWEKVDGHLPRVMLRDEAIHFLGVSPTQWNNAMSRHHTGFVINGERRYGHWMPTPINQPEFEAQGKKGHFSAEALFATQDIEKLVEEYADENGCAVSFFPNRGPLNWPASRATPAHFRNYLAIAVRGHFSNYCRTQDRRNKERLGDTFAEFRNYSDDSNQVSWEQNLPDPKDTQDTLVLLNQVTKKLRGTLREKMEGVSSCKPVQAHEDEMFDGLASGRTLEQVVNTMRIPRHVRRAVLRSIL